MGRFSAPRPAGPRNENLGQISSHALPQKEATIVVCDDLPNRGYETRCISHPDGTKKGDRFIFWVDKILTHLDKKAALAEPVVPPQSRAPPLMNLFD
jgi:hypothetical protein